MGIKPQERDYWTEGREAHRIIQEHVSGKKPHMFLKDFVVLKGLHFPIVEEKDFDPRCKFAFIHEHNGIKAKVIGFYDGRTEDYSRVLEIKTSSNPWSLGKFQRSIQRKLYALAHPEIEDQILITCRRKPKFWEKKAPKVYRVPATDRDRKEAEDWINEAIELFQSGDFDGGLNEHGVCDEWCYYGRNCQFK